MQWSLHFAGKGNPVSIKYRLTYKTGYDHMLGLVYSLIWSQLITHPLKPILFGLITTIIIVYLNDRP